MANSRGGLLDLPDRRGEASTFLPCTVCQTSYQAPHIGYIIPCASLTPTLGKSRQVPFLVKVTQLVRGRAGLHTQSD